MNKHCEKTTAHSQNILHGDTLYNFNRNKYNTFCASLAFFKVTCDRTVIIVYKICIFFLYLLCSWIIAIFKECMIKSRSSHCLYIDKFYFNASKLCQKWKRLQNVPHIYNVSIFYISKQNNAIYMLGVPSLRHQNHVVLFSFTIFYLKQKIWIHFCFHTK